MIDFEYFSWRSITELIRHIVFVFILALLAAIFIKKHDVLELIHRALTPNSLSNVFCSILVFSVPVYFICVIIDTFDEVRIDKRSGTKSANFIRSFCERIMYDITYIVYYFKQYCLVFFVLLGLSVFGLVFLL